MCLCEHIGISHFCSPKNIQNFSSLKSLSHAQDVLLPLLGPAGTQQLEAACKQLVWPADTPQLAESADQEPAGSLQLETDPASLLCRGSAWPCTGYTRTVEPNALKLSMERTKHTRKIQ